MAILAFPFAATRVTHAATTAAPHRRLANDEGLKDRTRMSTKTARLAIDMISRLAAASLLSVFVWNVYQSYQNTRSFGVLLLLVGEGNFDHAVVVAEFIGAGEQAPGHASRCQRIA